MFAELGHRQLQRGRDVLPIARRADRERRPFPEVWQIRSGGRTAKSTKSIEPTGIGAPSSTVTVTSTRVLLSFSFTSNAVTRASGIPAVSVERRDALEILVEAGIVEHVLPAPRQPGALARGERRRADAPRRRRSRRRRSAAARSHSPPHDRPPRAHDEESKRSRSDGSRVPLDARGHA